jgi:hypothetical protein
MKEPVRRHPTPARLLRTTSADTPERLAGFETALDTSMKPNTRRR